MSLFGMFKKSKSKSTQDTTQNTNSVQNTTQNQVTNGVQNVDLTQGINQTSTSNPNAPSWVTDLASGFAKQIPGLTTGVAELSGLQKDAAAGLQGQNFGGMFGDAANILKTEAARPASSVNDGDALGHVDRWLNPFLSGVVDSTSRDLDVSDGRVRAQQALNLERNGAFGGSGAALTQSMTEGELQRGRAASLGNLRMGAYDSAAANAQADASRSVQAQIAQAQADAQAQQARMAAANGMADIGNTGIGLQHDLGAEVTARDQALLDLPLTNASTQIGLFGELPANLLTGQTNTTNGTTTNQGTTTNNGTTNSNGTMTADELMKLNSKGTGSQTDLSFGGSWSPAKGFNQ